jgi:hypothetical protein
LVVDAVKEQRDGDGPLRDVQGNLHNGDPSLHEKRGFLTKTLQLDDDLFVLTKRHAGTKESLFVCSQEF